MPRSLLPTSSTEAKISPTPFSTRFSAADPFMFNWVEIWRMQEVSREEGEPQMARVMTSKVRGRVDDMQSRHTDAVFRTNITSIHQDYGVIFLPITADVKRNDELRVEGQSYQIVSINTAPGAFGPHHYEVFVDKVEGSV